MLGLCVIKMNVIKHQPTTNEWMRDKSDGNFVSENEDIEVLKLRSSGRLTRKVTVAFVLQARNCYWHHTEAELK